ncbi:phospholipid phosphatase-related protein type 1-like, partial [Amphiura filiformis]|uniref:phospholipid phosphatase-related protein type 1-like n=1 Tax=Amphiura filiformis TaxID=82378 RepID=UPI003B20F889
MKRFNVVVTNNLLVPCFFLIDCLLLVGLIVLWYFLVFTDSFRQHLPYIACQDVPYYSFPNLDGRVPEIVVYVLSFVLPPVVVLFGEAALSVYSLQGYRSPGADKTVITLGVRMHPIIRRTVRFVGLFLFGCFSTWVLSRTTQLITSQPSPYFFAECAAVPGTSCTGSQVVLELPECEGSNDDEARQSFPSLYASLSAYSAVYSGVYITSLLVLTSAKSVRPMLFLLILTIPYILGLERISYYKNSWTDVIGGWILGGVIGAYMSIHVLHCFRGSLTPSRIKEYYADNAHYSPELNGNKRFDRDYYRESQRSVRGRI